VPGKADWRAHGLPVEGEHAALPTVGGLARDEVVTCRLNDPVGPIREQVERSPYGFALVIAEGGIVLGRLRGSVMRDAPAGATAT